MLIGRFEESFRNHTAHRWPWARPQLMEHFRRCALCSSIHPGDLAAEVWQPEWTGDYPFRFNVSVPVQDAKAIRVLASRSTLEWSGDDEGWVSASELTKEQLAAVRAERWPIDPTRQFRFGRREIFAAKFFTTHLGEPGLDRKVKEAIERVLGLKFTFDGPSVLWRRYKPKGG